MENTNKFTYKNALITGAGSGIGLAIARLCAERGCSVLMVDVNAETLTTAANEMASLGLGRVEKVVADISSEEGIAHIKTRADSLLDGVDFLVNCAGVFYSQLSWQMTIDDWHALRRVNLDGAIQTVSMFVPEMIANSKPAHIVNVGSVASFLASPTMAAYSMSKFALRAYTETLKYELEMVAAPVNVSLFAPGPINTAIMTPQSGGIEDRDDLAGRETRRQMQQALKQMGMSARQAAEILIAGVEENKFWILTHPEYLQSLEQQAQNILNSVNPKYQAVTQ